MNDRNSIYEPEVEITKKDAKVAYKDDIFDRMMILPIFWIFYPFYRRHKEVLMYLFFGGIAFLLNIGLFAFLDLSVGINELVNNVICWVICVMFQFFTNRTWVFDGYVESVEGFIKQMTVFLVGRFFTLALEELILAAFITWLQYNSVAVKLVAQIIVIALNYIISKLIVFR